MASTQHVHSCFLDVLTVDDRKRFDEWLESDS